MDREKRAMPKIITMKNTNISKLNTIISNLAANPCPIYLECKGEESWNDHCKQLSEAVNALEKFDEQDIDRAINTFGYGNIVEKITLLPATSAAKEKASYEIAKKYGEEEQFREYLSDFEFDTDASKEEVLSGTGDEMLEFINEYEGLERFVDEYFFVNKELIERTVEIFKNEYFKDGRTSMDLLMDICETCHAESHDIISKIVATIYFNDIVDTYGNSNALTPNQTLEKFTDILSYAMMDTSKELTSEESSKYYMDCFSRIYKSIVKLVQCDLDSLGKALEGWNRFQLGKALNDHLALTENDPDVRFADDIFNLFEEEAADEIVLDRWDVDAILEYAVDNGFESHDEDEDEDFQAYEWIKEQELLTDFAEHQYDSLYYDEMADQFKKACSNVHGLEDMMFRVLVRVALPYYYLAHILEFLCEQSEKLSAKQGA